jgi:hypothetical protein
MKKFGKLYYDEGQYFSIKYDKFFRKLIAVCIVAILAVVAFDIYIFSVLGSP